MEVLGAELKKGGEGFSEVLEEQLVIGRVHVHIPVVNGEGSQAFGLTRFNKASYYTSKYTWYSQKK